jgi:hypothetical protein
VKLLSAKAGLFSSKLKSSENFAQKSICIHCFFSFFVFDSHELHMAQDLRSSRRLMRALHLLLMPVLSTMSSTGVSAGARLGVAVGSARGGEGGEGGDELSCSLAVVDIGGWPAEVTGRDTRATAAPSCKCTTCSGSERDRMVLPHLAGCNLCGSVR